MLKHLHIPIFLLTFAIGIVRSHDLMIRAKLAPPFPIYMRQGLERVSYMNKKTLEQVKSALVEVWGDRYIYDHITENNFIDTQHPVPIECREHGIWYTTLSRHKCGVGCPLCGNESRKKKRLDHALKKTGKVFGVGINDYYESSIKQGEAKVAYQTWTRMLQRCYDKNYIKKQNKRTITSVCKEWLYFSNFKKWFDDPVNGYRHGYCLDKDLIVNGNTIYSPDTCCFLPKEINSLFRRKAFDSKSNIVGVRKQVNKYVVICNGKYMGTFDSEREAFEVFKENKKKKILEAAKKYFEKGMITSKVYEAMINYKIEFLNQM